MKKVDKLLLQCEQLAAAGDWAGCAADAERALLAEPAEPLVAFEAQRWRCRGLAKDEQFADAVAACAQALALKRDARVLCDRADALLGLDLFDDGQSSLTSLPPSLFESLR